MQRTSRDRALVILLRLCGGVTCLAAVAVFMPIQWMNIVHERLNLGPLPQGPMFEYMARTLSAMYVIHAGLCFTLSTNVAQYRAVINFLAWSMLIFAVLVLWIDYSAKMPRLWAAAESPMVLLVSLLMLILNKRN